MEKKLTDEEIAQALLQNIEYSKTLTYFDKWGNHKAIMITDIIDFINRLQDEKKELKSIAEYQQGSNMERWQIIQEKDKMIAEQKAEIERLTKLAELRLRDNQDTCKLLAKKEKQVDELKNRFENKACCNMSENCSMVKQAVKDTAKEIFTQVLEWSPVGEDYHWFITTLGNWLKEKYGVEVE